MNIINFIQSWHSDSDDPVRNCRVYRKLGCAHVDGMLCNLRTCDVVVHLEVSPSGMKEVSRDGRYEPKAAS